MKYVKIAVLALTLIGAALPELAMARCRHRRCCDSCCNSCSNCGSGGCSNGGCQADPAPAPSK